MHFAQAELVLAPLRAPRGLQCLKPNTNLSNPGTIATPRRTITHRQESPLRIIDIPPYQRAGVNYDPAEGHFMMKDLIASMKAKGQLDGVEIDIDEGEPTAHGAESRDDAVVTNIA